MCLGSVFARGPGFEITNPMNQAWFANTPVHLPCVNGNEPQSVKQESLAIMSINASKSNHKRAGFNSEMQNIFLISVKSKTYQYYSIG